MHRELVKILADELEEMIGEEISTDELLLKAYKSKITDKELIRVAEYIDDAYEIYLVSRLIQQAKERGIKLDFSKHKYETVGLPQYISFVVKRGRKRNPKFDSKIEQIKEICYWCGGCFNPQDNIKIRFDGEKVVRLEIPFGYDESCLEEMIEHEFIKSNVLEMTKKEFLAEFRKLNVGMWAKDYSDPTILDGTQWELEIKYEDGKTRKYSGSNDFPRTFDALSKLVGDKFFEDEE